MYVCMWCRATFLESALRRLVSTPPTCHVCMYVYMWCRAAVLESYAKHARPKKFGVFFLVCMPTYYACMYVICMCVVSGCCLGELCRDCSPKEGWFLKCVRSSTMPCNPNFDQCFQSFLFLHRSHTNYTHVPS